MLVWLAIRLSSEEVTCDTEKSGREKIFWIFFLAVEGVKAAEHGECGEGLSLESFTHPAGVNEWISVFLRALGVMIFLVSSLAFGEPLPLTWF